MLSLLSTASSLNWIAGHFPRCVFLVQAARATFAQIHGYDPKASNDAVMSHLESRNRKVKRVKADLR